MEEEFVRTRNTGAFSEIRENLPFVLTYNPQSLSYYDKRLSDHDT